MLLQCQQRTQTSGSSEWRCDPKFHCIVEALQEKLYDLEQSAADRPPPDVLQQYKAHVRAIADELRQPDLPAYCLRVTAQDRVADGSSAKAAGTASSALQGASRSLAQHKAARDATSSRRHQQDGGKRSTAAAAAAATAGQQQQQQQEAPGFSLSSGAKDQLQVQQRLQDELTGELLDMTQELKASTLAMQSAIRFRGKLLDDAEESLVHSTANAQSVAAKAKQQHKQASWNFCKVLLMLLVVAVVFSFMIVWIKLTSMVGLKGQR
uniref:t-SNARE coiled-coil homology domain-containing protein n=1 Tax=Tetradesmus obliquus TaxID=3088 RepID=A0A383WPK6_TETOB|eukprot:jgi/Sobl393_1/18786/SZX79094.1